MFTDNVSINENNLSTVTTSHFSYFVRPSVPCVLGREHYDDEINDDEFFLTAGGIVHSCPNIYELSTDNQRQRQSCDHLLFIDRQGTLINSIDHRTSLNAYETTLDRYSILPRFPTSLTSNRLDSSLSSSSSTYSTDSIALPLKSYKQRHAIGLSRRHYADRCTSLSNVSTNCKSDNHLVFMRVIQRQTSMFNTMENSQRSRSHDIIIEPIYSSGTN
jgi:hypothetical protein